MATQVSSNRVNTAYAPATKRAALAENGYRPSYVPAAIAAGLVFVLYLITLAPSVAMWDTGEYMAAVKVLGIPHPPGNPFFVILGHAFASLPIPVSYAERINIMAALASAISAGLWFLITERVVARWVPERWERLVIASLSTLIGATAFTVWNQSVVNEKVYTIALAFTALDKLWLMDMPNGHPPSFIDLFEQSPEPAYVLDPLADRIVAANEVGCSLLGYSQDELLATPVSQIHPADLPQLRDFVEQVVRDGRASTIMLTCRTKLGTFLPTEMSLHASGASAAAGVASACSSTSAVPRIASMGSSSAPC